MHPRCRWVVAATLGFPFAMAAPFGGGLRTRHCVGGRGVCERREHEGGVTVLVTHRVVVGAFCSARPSPRLSGAPGTLFHEGGAPSVIGSSSTVATDPECQCDNVVFPSPARRTRTRHPQRECSP